MKSLKKLNFFNLAIIFVLLFSSLASAQKQLSRAYSSMGIENILIDGNGVHSLIIEAKAVEEIVVNVYLEGETSEEIVIKEKIENKSLSLGFDLWPLAQTYNDKLSAHKVVSVEVRIVIPEDKFVSITSATSSVLAKGIFENLYVDIEDKPCVLKGYTGNANVKTNAGEIRVSVTNKETYGVPKSTYGTIVNNLTREGKYIIYAQSVHGNIFLKQTQ